MARYTKAALERRAIRRNFDARKHAPNGTPHANYDVEAIEEARKLSSELPKDWRWRNCSGIR